MENEKKQLRELSEEELKNVTGGMMNKQVCGNDYYWDPIIKECVSPNY